MKDITIGFCQCGCGQKTNLAIKTSAKWNHIKNCPVRFIKGHNSRGSLHHHWSGGIKNNGEGYVEIKCSNHPKSCRGYVYEHILVAEQALGSYLPDGAVIHHVDGNKKNNDNNNLVICNSDSYHKLLHQRHKALISCGNANYLKCSYCQKYDDKKNLYVRKNSNQGWHAKCSTMHRKNKNTSRGK